MNTELSDQIAPDFPSIFFEALEKAKGLLPSPKNIERVAGQTSLEASRWAFNQWHLRKLGIKKFQKAEEMLFTAEALEQSSHQNVASYHASRFPNGVLVADLTTGIGGDLIQISARGEAIGFEIDRERAAYARFNSGSEVLDADCLSVSWDWEYGFADPGRRNLAGRRLTMDTFEPSPCELSERMASLKIGGIKLSPMNQDEELDLLGGRLEFVSFGRECRESIVWLGSEVQRGRFAVHIESNETLTSSMERASEIQLCEYFFEADPAAIRANCLPAICEKYSITELGDTNGYLVGDSPIVSPWLTCFRVLNSGNFHERDLKSFGAISEIKTRKVNLDPAKLIRRVKRSAFGKSLILYKVNKSIQFIVAERL